jgi:hypothetical protein
MVEFIRRMTESMEALKKQNEDLNMCLTIAEGQNSRRDHEKDRCARIRMGRRLVDPNQQVEGSLV